MNRRDVIKGLLGITATALLPVAPAQARRGGGRVSMGRGLANGAHYDGSVLSRDQLKQCVIEEQRINNTSDILDNKEAQLSIQEHQVDHYSQYSVDRYNQLVNDFNSEGERLNSMVNRFNQKCGDHAYYASDMSAVKRELNIDN